MGLGLKWKDLAFVGIPLAFVYALTVGRDLGTIDSGELATVVTHLGVAHPTGYALYTCLGRIFVLVLPMSGIVSANVFSAVCVWVAAVLATGFFRGLLLREWGRSGRAASGRLWRHAPDFLSICGGLLLGTSSVVWDQAIGNEVYGLHLVFVVAILRWSLSLLPGHPGSPGRPSSRSLLAGAYLVALASANHLSIVFLLPAVLGVWVWTLRRIPSSGRIVGLAFGLGLLGFSLNLFLPVRSAMGPLLDWGAPQTWDRFWSHYLAEQYRIWHFQSSEQFSSNLTGYLAGLAGRFSWAMIVFSGVGMVRLAQKERAVFAFLLAVFGTTVVWASGYEIFDLEPYYLPADVVVAAGAVVGCLTVAAGLLDRVAPPTQSEGRHSTVLSLFAVAVLGMVLWQPVTGWASHDRRDDSFVRTHVEMSVAGLPEGTLLYSGFWDAFVSPSLYLQAVECFRPDLAIVDPELLRRSWYFPQLRRWHPELLRPVEAEVEAFLEELRLFETGEAYDGAKIENRYRTLISKLATSVPDRAVVFTGDVQANFVRTPAVPEGLVYRLRPNVEEVPVLAPPSVQVLLDAGYRPNDRIHRQVLEYWIQMIRTRLGFLESTRREKESGPWKLELELAMRALNPAETR